MKPLKGQLGLQFDRPARRPFLIRCGAWCAENPPNGMAMGFTGVRRAAADSRA